MRIIKRMDAQEPLMTHFAPRVIVCDQVDSGSPRMLNDGRISVLGAPIYSELDGLISGGRTCCSVVDFQQVIRNAAAEGIPLQEIMILYEGLTPAEMAFLGKHQEITNISPQDGRVTAKFPLKGFPLYQEKAMAVIHLGA